MENAASEEGLRGVNFFKYTDNLMVEVTFYNGSSSIRSLDELVMRLKNLEAQKGMRLHFIHIARTWMIELGLMACLVAASQKV
jgi:hypothetical protein